jgi:methylenetetrahydrofolate reductase (NADPH)
MTERLGTDGEGSRDFPHAADLVAYIRKQYPHFSIGVAGFPEGHPATPNRLREIELLKAKVEAGADYIVTQLFFDNRDYFDYMARLRLAAINVPVVPGIMPITSRHGMGRMADLAAGARFPAPLLRAVSRARDDEAVGRVGTHWATAQIAELLYADVTGIHLYTLNNSSSTIDICRNLGLDSYRVES